LPELEGGWEARAVERSEEREEEEERVERIF